MLAPHGLDGVVVVLVVVVEACWRLCTCDCGMAGSKLKREKGSLATCAVLCDAEEVED